MFSALLNKANEQIVAVQKSIEVNDEFRARLASNSLSDHKFTLKAVPPRDTDWRIYDHCAALTRLYAIYESFVEELLTDVLTLLPNLFSYSELKDDFRRHHRNGIAHVLEKIDKRYKRLHLVKVIRDYHNALSGEEQYIVLPQAMMRHEENLRLDVLSSLFDRLDINNVNSWMTNHIGIRHYFMSIRGEQNTLEAELSTFIQYRNDAAHGYVDEFLGVEQILTYCEFVKALCNALYERLNHWVLSRKLVLSQAIEIGTVTEELQRAGAVIITIRDSILSLGDKLFFFGNQYCYPASITSIQDDDVACDEITITGEKEIGVKTDVAVRKNARVIRAL